MRTLYQCLEAKVKGDQIYCAKGHTLNKLSPTRNIHIRQLQKGKPLEVGICQKCLDFTYMGETPLAKERGWK